jgi:hypothetical protein
MLSLLHLIDHFLYFYEYLYIQKLVLSSYKKNGERNTTCILKAQFSHSMLFSLLKTKYLKHLYPFFNLDNMPSKT